jgi:hypothetical protein
MPVGLPQAWPSTRARGENLPLCVLFLPQHFHRRHRLRLPLQRLLQPVCNNNTWQWVTQRFETNDGGEYVRTAAEPASPNIAKAHCLISAAPASCSPGSTAAVLVISIDCHQDIDFADTSPEARSVALRSAGSTQVYWR